MHVFLAQSDASADARAFEVEGVAAPFVTDAKFLGDLFSHPVDRRPGLGLALAVFALDIDFGHVGIVRLARSAC